MASISWCETDHRRRDTELSAICPPNLPGGNSIKGGATEAKSSQRLQMSFKAKPHDFGSIIIFSKLFLRRRNSQKPRCLHGNQSVRGNQQELKDLLAFSPLTLFFCLGMITWKGCRVLRSSLPQKPARLPCNQTEGQQKCCQTTLVYWGGSREKPVKNSHFSSGKNCVYRKGTKLSLT